MSLSSTNENILLRARGEYRDRGYITTTLAVQLMQRGFIVEKLEENWEREQRSLWSKEADGEYRH